MLRGIITVVLLVLLVVGGWMLYTRITGGQGVHNGDVYTLNSGEKDQMETGTTYIGDKPLEEAHPTPSRSDEPGTINTVPQTDYNAPTYPQQQQPYPAAPKAPVVTPAQPYSPYGQQPYNKLYPPARQVSDDTFSPNPPNGLAYAGTGTFEVYRQGDLTFRLDTKSGTSCVLYATMEEWSKPIVYSHGCGSRWWRNRYRGDSYSR